MQELMEQFFHYYHLGDLEKAYTFWKVIPKRIKYAECTMGQSFTMIEYEKGLA